MRATPKNKKIELETMTKFQPKTLILKDKEVVLRKGMPSDAEKLVQFLTIISEETPFTYNYPGQKIKAEDISARLDKELASPTSLRVLALAGDNIVGAIGFWRNSPDHPWLQHKGEFAMMVVKAWWGTGLAKVLLKSMENFARATGVKKIDATVSCTNERGIGLYTKNGYVIEGTAKAYKLVDGKPFDSHYIAKFL